MMRCIDDRLTPFYLKSLEFNAHIRHFPGTNTGPGSTPTTAHHKGNFIPYVGNGLFGLEIQQDSHFMIKSGRNLGVPVFFHPLVSISNQVGGGQREATVTDYMNGVVHR